MQGNECPDMPMWVVVLMVVWGHTINARRNLLMKLIKHLIKTFIEDLKSVTPIDILIVGAVYFTVRWLIC